MGRPIGSKNKPQNDTPRSPISVVKTKAVTYLASIKVFGKIYNAAGATLTEAIAGLKPEGLARGMSIITVKKGEATQEKILPRVATVRLFSPSAMMRDVALKHTVERFSL
jgi:hypothetical protein